MDHMRKVSEEILFINIAPLLKQENENKLSKSSE